MTSTSRSAKWPEVTALDLAAVQACARVDPNVRELLLEVLTSTEVGTRSRKANDFAKEARSGMPNAVLPFRRDPLDILVAAWALPATPASGLRFFGEDAIVDLGFFRFQDGDAFYVSDTLTRHETDLKTPELLAPAALAELVAMLSSVARENCRVFVDLDSPTLVGFQHDLIRHPSEARKCPGYQLRNPRSPVKIHLLRSTASGGVTVRNLGPGEILPSPAGAFHLNLIAPENMIEFHGAAAAGQWFLVEHSMFQLLAPLPDISKDDDEQPVWADFGGVFQKRIGIPRAVELPIDRTIALSLMDRFPFCASPDRAAWYRLAATVTSSTDGVHKDAT